MSRKIYWSALTIIFLVAAWQRFRLPLEPIADPDTWGYLAPALRKLTGLEFGHTHGRNFVYPAFVYILLRLFGDFRAITVAQQLLGLAAGGLLLLTWRRMRVFVANPKINSGVYDGLGLAAVAAFFFGGDPVPFEGQLRPEGVCAFVISIILYAAVQCIGRALVERGEPSITYGIVLVFASVLLGSLKPSFWLPAVVGVAPVFLFFWQSGHRRQKLALAGGSIASAVLLLLPEHFLRAHDEDSQIFLPTTLFAIHADLIRDQMAADLKSGAPVPYPRDWLANVHARLASEIEKSTVASPYRFYGTLGFDPEYLMFDQDSIGAQLRREARPQVAALCGFYYYYYQRIWLKRPIAVGRKVAREMAMFYAPVCPVYGRGKRVHLTDEYRRAVASLAPEEYREVWSAYAPAVEFMQRSQLLSTDAPVVQQQHGQRLRSLLARCYLPLLLAAFVAGAVVALKKEYRHRLGLLALVVGFAYLFNAASCFEVAVVNALDVRRYITVQLLFAVFAQFLALWFLIEFCLAVKTRHIAQVQRT